MHCKHYTDSKWNYPKWRKREKIKIKSISVICGTILNEITCVGVPKERREMTEQKYIWRYVCKIFPNLMKTIHPQIENPVKFSLKKKLHQEMS